MVICDNIGHGQKNLQTRMKTEIEKIVEEREKVVFRLDLIPESKDDAIALANLESDGLDVTDRMIQSIVEQNANKLLKAQGFDWTIERLEKKKGFSSYYIHLRMLKLMSIPIDYPQEPKIDFNTIKRN